MSQIKWTRLGPGVRPRVRNAIEELRAFTAPPPGKTLFVDGDYGSSGGNAESWETAVDTIQAAVDLCGNGDGDIIYVAPHKYQENVLILDHKSISIIAASTAGWEFQCRASDASTKYDMTTVGGVAVPGFSFVVLSRGVTIDGFLLDGGGGYGGIYVGDGYRISTSYDENAASARIRNCVFRGGGEGNHAMVLDGCSDNVVIEDCVFDNWTQACIQLDAGGSRTVQNPIIRHCTFKNIASGIYAIDMYSSATTVGAVVGPGNVFADKTGVNGYSCRFQSTGVHHFVGNFDGTNGGATGSATDYMAGNFEAHAMNSPVYVAES